MNEVIEEIQKYLVTYDVYPDGDFSILFFTKILASEYIHIKYDSSDGKLCLYNTYMRTTYNDISIERMSEFRSFIENKYSVIINKIV